MPIDWQKVKEEASRILSDYIKIDTTNPPGRELAAALYLSGILEKDGFAASIFESQPERGNLVCPWEGTGDLSPLIVLHHMDVVPAETAKWKYPPQSGTLAEGEIWGRGAQDCKSLGVMELVALLLLKREGFKPRRKIIYVATVDEEAGGKWGADWLVQNQREMLKADFVINEGGGMAMPAGERNLFTCQTAEKGLCWLKLVFRGKPGHASIPHDDNCIVKMARAIERISSYHPPVRRTRTTEDFIKGVAKEQAFWGAFTLKQLLNPLFSKAAEKRIPDPGLRGMAGAILRNTFVPTVVQGGQKTNVIPSECSCQVDCRILPGVTPEMVKREIGELLHDFKDYSLEILQTSPASESPVDNALYKSIEKSMRRLDPKSKIIPTMHTGATDSRYFRERGAAAYGFQPLPPTKNISEYLSLVHGHNERISTDSLLFGTRALYEIIKDFCG